MAILEILTLPDPRLSKKARPVTDVDAIQPLIEDMLETMYHSPDGVGLASTQVGRPEAVIVIDYSEMRDQPLILLNPKITKTSEEKVCGTEGCLSIPDYYADVERYSAITVSALDREGGSIQLEAEGFLAIALQHEIDHLNGILFIDHLSPLKRNIALRKAKIIKREQYQDWVR